MYLDFDKRGIYKDKIRVQVDLNIPHYRTKRDMHAQDLKHEVVEWYFSSRAQAEGADSGALDPIPAEIVGTVRLPYIARLARAPHMMWATLVLDLLLGTTTPDSVEGERPFIRVRRPDVLLTLAAIGLVERCNEATKALCGLFTVPKKNGLSRVIFDARPANAALARHPTPFSTFHLRDLLQRWSEVGGRVSTIDYRHFFYQIPLAKPLRPYFVLSAEGVRWQPTVLTMGWQDAPLCAQTITWLAVLHREAGESSLGIEAIFAGEHLPQYATVTGPKGNPMGYIFVLLDGVAVMGARRELHGAIMRRIQRNTRLFGITVKELGTDEFAGVVFSVREGLPSWRAATPLPLWEKPHTRRAVAQQLGSLLWQLRVAQVPLLGKEPLLALFSRVGASSLPWSDPFQLTDTELQVLAAEWSAWTTVRWCSSPAKTPGCALRWSWVVTDATPTSVAALVLGDRGQILSQHCQLDLPRDSQVLREMDAILSGVRLISPGSGCILATDADVCRRAIQKGYSSSACLRNRLRDLVATRVVLILLRVDSASNPADEPSRGLPVSEEKTRDLCPSFEHAQRGAMTQYFDL